MSRISLADSLSRLIKENNYQSGFDHLSEVECLNDWRGYPYLYRKTDKTYLYLEDLSRIFSQKTEGLNGAQATAKQAIATKIALWKDQSAQKRYQIQSAYQRAVCCFAKKKR